MVLDGDLALSHHDVVIEHVKNHDIDAFLVGVAESLVLGDKLLIRFEILVRRIGAGDIAGESLGISLKPCNGF